jgi:protein-S-isoprenylcysteine O-methyltransferase Ste14/membrane-associated phospholipid phosphatase
MAAVKRPSGGPANEPGGGPDGNLTLFVLGALIGGVTTSLTGFLSQSPLQVVMGVGLIALGTITLLKLRIAATPSIRAAAAEPTGHRATRWGWTCIVASLAFVAVAITVRLAGVPAVERQIYEAAIAALPKMDHWRLITRLGSESVLFPAGVFLIVLLPRQFLRHWWLWVVVMLAASGLEGLGKEVIGRPRPESLRPGFPSGHVSAAVAFYPMAAYVVASAVRSQWARWTIYAVAAVCTGLVAVSRLALRAHWPLDVVGGAALGLGVVAGAVWWHERHPDAWRVLGSIPSAWRHAIYRSQNLGQVILIVVVVLLRPPLAADDSLLDLAFDVFGGVSIAAGLLLRVWVAGHAGERATLGRGLPTRLVTTGPYAYMRQPLPLSALLVGIGVVVLAESGPGLTLIPAALILMCRITIPLEETHLANRFGGAYVAYCARVPRFPRNIVPVVVAAGTTIVRPHRMRWRSLSHDLPALGTTLALTVLAETHEFLPHLLR